jgi:SAM-dependent methyltransferase
MRGRSSLEKAMSVTRMLRNASRKHGFIRTLRLGLHELLFDLRNGTETSLEIADNFLFLGNECKGCEGSNPLLFSRLLHQVPLDWESSVFLDYGAGKGRALILAAQHGFRKAIGVELSDELCVAARKNIEIYHRRHRASAIEVHCGDAADFDVPGEVDVAYFFNAFDAEVMLATVDRISKSLCRFPREFYVICLYPRFIDLFINAGFTRFHQSGAEVVLRRPLVQRSGRGLSTMRTYRRFGDRTESTPAPSVVP